MATRAISVDNTNPRALVIQWTGLTQATLDDGAPFEGADWSDRSVQIQGTFGTGGSVSIEGSNDGTNYQLLTDPQGNDITKTAADLEQITEITRYIRPRVTAGDGTTSLTVTIYARRQP
jgi:hypothetical protein